MSWPLRMKHEVLIFDEVFLILIELTFQSLESKENV